MHLYPSKCDGNYPHVIQIEPGQKITYNGILQIANTSVIENHADVRIGFVLIKEKEIFDYYDFFKILHDKIKAKKDIIWSDAFKIKE